MIVRNPIKKQYTKIDTRMARNGTFRPDELGLYTAMLAHSDNWDFSEKALSRETAWTGEEIRGILLRLEKKGFVRQRVTRFGAVWDLIEDPTQKIDPQTGEIITVHGDDPDAHKDVPPEKLEQPPAPEAPMMAPEVMAQMFFDKAEELRKVAAERRWKR